MRVHVYCYASEHDDALGVRYGDTPVRQSGPDTPHHSPLLSFINNKDNTVLNSLLNYVIYIRNSRTDGSRATQACIPVDARSVLFCLT